MIELDNIKMWESIRGFLQHIVDINKGIVDSEIKLQIRTIDKALKDQGLQYNTDTKKIESIEPESFKLEKGKWYMCIVTSGDNYVKGQLWKGVEKDGELWINNGGCYCQPSTEYFNRIFRPATKEEIPHEDYHWNGEIRVRKVTGVLKKMLDNIDEEELAKTREEMTKESSDGELTELELHFGQFVYGDAWAKREIDEKEKTFVKLCIRDIILPAARKQLQPEIDAEIEQAYKNQDEVQYRNGYNKCVEDARNAFCKTCKIGKCNSSECVYLNDFKKALEKEKK